jgi:hypothetical protein
MSFSQHFFTSLSSHYTVEIPLTSVKLNCTLYSRHPFGNLNFGRKDSLFFSNTLVKKSERVSLGKVHYIHLYHIAEYTARLPEYTERWQQCATPLKTEGNGANAADVYSGFTLDTFIEQLIGQYCSLAKFNAVSRQRIRSQQKFM